MAGYAWQRISDLTPAERELASTELRSLAPIWQGQRDKLKQSSSLVEFNQRLGRRWAIETGVIERLYAIERGITLTLIEKGFQASLIPHGATDKPPELVIRILEDQEDVLEGIFDFVAQRRPLSTGYIKEMHAAFTRHQHTCEAVDQFGRLLEIELLKGDWKRMPNNPSKRDGAVHQYCPPEHVASEMDRLIALHLEHDATGVAPEIEAAWLHHRFTQIHPFQDGNGRVARALATLVFLRAGWFPLVVDRDDISKYIGALETADNNGLDALISLFARQQVNAFVEALSIADNVLAGQAAVSQIVEAAVARLRERFQGEQQSYHRVFEHERAARAQLHRRLDVVRREIRDQLKAAPIRFEVTVAEANSENSYWYKFETGTIAKASGYYADLRTFQSWCRLAIREVGRSQTDIVFVIHSLGHNFVGVLGITAFIRFRDLAATVSATGSQPSAPLSITANVFQFAYTETASQIEARLDAWFDSAIAVALDEWRKHL